MRAIIVFVHWSKTRCYHLFILSEFVIIIDVVGGILFRSKIQVINYAWSIYTPFQWQVEVYLKGSSWAFFQQVVATGRVDVPCSLSWVGWRQQGHFTSSLTYSSCINSLCIICSTLFRNVRFIEKAHIPKNLSSYWLHYCMFIPYVLNAHVQKHADF